MFELSIVIPARNEEFLPQTVEDLLSHTSDKTEVLVGLDGYDIDLPEHPRLRVHKEAESIGQRAMQNRLVEMSTAKYVAKTDAHCAFDDDFDTKMLARMEDDITLVPVMRNLHVFNWVCSFCGATNYQGPRIEQCIECQNVDIKRDIVWIPKTNPQSSAYRFNKNLQFKYFPELRQKLPKEGLQESMSLQGSFFMCTREKYWSLKLCDESWGSWGNQGSEVAIKTWLSGGRVYCNFDTWYAHLFRTQKDFSFPYPMSGRAQQRARQISRDLFLNNAWEHQVRPLSWIIERFWFALKEVGDKEAFWDERALAELKTSEASITFPRQKRVARLASSSPTPGDSRGQFMSSDAVSSSGLDSTVTITPKNIDPVAGEAQVVGIDAPTVTADMVNNGNVSSKVSSEGPNEPRIYDSMNSNLRSPKADSAVPEVVAVSSPFPATSDIIETNLGEKSPNEPRIESVDSEPSLRHSPHSIPQRGILYFTDNELPVKLAKNVQQRIRQIAEDKGMELVSSTRKPMDKMGKNVVTPKPRGYLTMFEQILKGLEAMDSDIVFMAEHDVLYPPEHFDFTPPDKNTFYYDVSWWKIHKDGLAIRWRADQVSGLCAYRETLLNYYRERVKSFDPANFDRKFEPMSGIASAQWEATRSHIDVRHGRNLTYNKRGLHHFRNKESAINLETNTIDNIPGWNPEELRYLL